MGDEDQGPLDPVALLVVCAAVAVVLSTLWVMYGTLG